MRQEALSQKVLEARVAVALAQLVRRVAHYRLEVDIHGTLPAERVVQKIVFGRGHQVFHAADAVRYPHQVIVDDVGEVVRRHAVGLDKDIVLEVFEVDGHVAENLVVIRRRAAFGYVLPDDVRLACGDSAFYLGFAEFHAVLVVFGRARFVQIFEPLL